VKDLESGDSKTLSTEPGYEPLIAFLREKLL
jgi:hypothetical protein